MGKTSKYLIKKDSLSMLTIDEPWALPVQILRLHDSRILALGKELYTSF